MVVVLDSRALFYMGVGLRQEHGIAGRLSEYSPCRYSGRAICRFYGSIGLLLSTGLQGVKGWRGALFLLAKSVTARSERKLVRLIGLGKIFGIGLWEYWRTRGGSRKPA